MSRESVTAMGRAFEERGMTATCRIGDYEPAVGDDLASGYALTNESYTGICALKISNATTGSTVDVGAQLVAIRDAVLRLPVATSGAVHAGQMVEIVTNPDDPSTVGLQLHIAAGHDQTYSVSRRFPVEVMP